MSKFKILEAIVTEFELWIMEDGAEKIPLLKMNLK
jgi:hypothetical protein